MILVNISYIPGKEFELIGLVKGSIIQSRHLGSDFVNALKTIVGGEMKGYSQMMNEARAKATKRMVEDAEKLGADAIINVRYTSASVVSNAAEVLAYGTAVKFK